MRKLILSFFLEKSECHGKLNNETHLTVKWYFVGTELVKVNRWMKLESLGETNFKLKMFIM